MSITQEPIAVEAVAGDSQNAEALLKRILVAVESDKRRGRMELLIAIILSLATLASTWCGYQARQWGGMQGAKQATADTAERKAAEDTIVGLQLRTFDGMTVLHYWDSLRQGDTQACDALFARMRPVLQRAIEASLAAGVLRDPTVAGPMQRPEYVLEAEQDAQRLRRESFELNAEAKFAGRAAGDYVLLTLMFASVLFFGGITGTFTARRVRLGLGYTALLLFLVAMAMLSRLPVYVG